MDNAFREDLKGLMKENGGKIALPRVFVRGKDVGGAEEVVRIAEEGDLGKLFDIMPNRKAGDSGNVRFVPSFRCSGGFKVISTEDKGKSVAVVARCGDCNKNGLVLCPLCS